MQWLVNAYSRTEGFLRDLFQYVVPATPTALAGYVLCRTRSVPVLEGTKDIPFVDNSFVAVGMLLILLYVLGRILNSLAHVLFPLLDRVFGCMPSRFLATRQRTRDQLAALGKQMPEMKRHVELLGPGHFWHFLQIHVYKQSPEIYQMFVERYSLIQMFQTTMAAGAFVMAVCFFFCAPAAWVYIAAVLSLGVCLLLYRASVLNAAGFNRLLLAAALHTIGNDPGGPGKTGMPRQDHAADAEDRAAED